ncbi:hypothetical protein [Aureimonas flava]|uniref:hypothetical protein n=1 Tax=Aureimonas flava TaxID=2320271 RepID=UPI0010A960F3|nr:hypothetical protein [Aureimonas flava]
MSEAPRVRPRYEWRTADHHDECWCIDLLTGQEVYRYDMGDPAEYSPSHGALTPEDALYERGLDPYEVMPTPSEIGWRQRQGGSE